VPGIALGIVLVALNIAHGYASTPTAPPPLNLVVIGDSIPFAGFCTTCRHAFVSDYALRLESALGREVNVINRSRNDGAQLNQIAEQVATEAFLREQLSSADLVIISAGFNDGPPWTAERPCGADLGPTIRDIIDQFLTYTEDCLDTAVAAREDDFRRRFTSVDDLVPDASPVLVVNAYNAWTGWPALATEATVAELAQFDTARVYFLDAWNDQECAIAAERGFICIDLYHAFNGPDGKTPAGDLLELDYSHPSAKGNTLIADLLMESDVFGLSAVSPSAVEASPLLDAWSDRMSSIGHHRPTVKLCAS
jgi:lysophospholipase L1-like esterase